MLPVTGDSKAINLHAIFDPEIADELEELFFSKLEFRYAEETYTCTRDSLERLGRKFSNDTDLSDQAAYRADVEQFKVTLEDLRRLCQKNQL